MVHETGKLAAPLLKSPANCEVLPPQDFDTIFPSEPILTREASTDAAAWPSMARWSNATAIDAG